MAENGTGEEKIEKAEKVPLGTPEPRRAAADHSPDPERPPASLRPAPIEPPPPFEPPPPGERFSIRPWVEGLTPTIKYWFETEVHVYAFSMAAMALLAFFPFLIVMVSICRHFFEWRAGEEAIYIAILDTFPRTEVGGRDDMGDFIVRNLRVTVSAYGSVQFVSLVILLFAANGLFQPLEVALNRVWGVLTNRSYWKNQIISLFLVLVCGGLALLSTVITAMNTQASERLFGSGSIIASFISVAAFKIAVVPISILILFLIYWLLPNTRISWKEILPAATIVGVLLEGLKWVYFLLWPMLHNKLQWQYGPFRFSVSFLLFAAAASFLILAGAEWTARRSRSAARL